MATKKDRSTYFPANETACKCGCGLDNWSQQTMDMLHTARVIYNGPIVVTSWCRCESHNAKVGGSLTSSHPKGVAVDIKVSHLSTKKENALVQALYSAGFRRLGLPSSASKLHVDTDSTKPEAIWFY